MATPFSRTIRSLEADSSRRRSVVLLAVFVLLGAWGAWFFLARVPVYEVTTRSRLETVSAAHPVASRVDGLVVSTSLEIGREVKQGDVLVELDSEPQRLALEEAGARLADVEAQLAALRPEIESERRAIDEHREVSNAAIAEAKARVGSFEARVAMLRQKAESRARLKKTAVAGEEVLEAQTEAEASAAELDALRLAVTRLEHKRAVDEMDRKTHIAALGREAVQLDGMASIARATIRRLEREVERRTVRAPIAGVVGEAREFRPGAVVEAAERLGAIVPPGKVRAVGFFPVAGAGRIRPGQPARLRLDGFAWTRFGTLRATVDDVASEASEGRIRVELIVEPESAPGIPMEHGLPGTAEVEVERMSPAALVLRLIGRTLSPRTES